MLNVIEDAFEMVEGTPTPTPRLEGTANLSAHLIVAHAMRHTCLLHRPVEKC